MACAHTWNLYDKNTREFIGRVPCGRCVNCIIDTRNRYCNEANEEIKNFSGLCSYVTLTYDSNHLPLLADNNGAPIPSIDYEDLKKFNKRIREYMRRHHMDCKGASPHFKYIACAEYGDKKERDTGCGRPHFHIAYFGLDYRFCEKMFRECWRAGQIDIKPVKNGCVRYIASYISKQVKSSGRPVFQYEARGRRRPRVVHSKGFGNSLYVRNYEYAKEHDWSYKGARNKLVPYPRSWLRTHCIRTVKNIDLEKGKQKYRDYNGKSPKTWSFSEYNKFLHSLAVQREANLAAKLERSGEPVPRYEFLEFSYVPEKFRRELKVATQSYKQMCKNILDPDSDWCYSGQSKFFPSYHSWYEVQADIDKFGDVVPF